MRKQRRKQIARLRERLQSIIAPLEGRIFNTAGDGFMIAFGLASSGVQAALQLLTASDGAHSLPPIRIGLHLGEVIAGANGDLLGHGVNVAARLQALAEPGTAIVSDVVRKQVRTGAGIPFKTLGKVQLHKMNERLEVFALTGKQRVGFKEIGRRRNRVTVYAMLLLVALTGAGIAGWHYFHPDAEAAIPRIAVFKFESLGDTEPYFAEGLADEVIAELSGIDGIEVVARSSSFALQGQGATPAYRLLTSAGPTFEDGGETTFHAFLALGLDL